MTHVSILGWLVLLCGMTSAGEAMAAKKVLASEVEGQLVADAGGTPVRGVTVIRRWKWAWTGTEGEARAVTDDQGRFRFPEVTGRSLTAGILPHQPSIGQEFIVELGSGQPPVLILGLRKLDYDVNGETQGVPMRLQCRTDLEAGDLGFYWGTCKLLD